MNIILAKTAGFCFGVNRAVSTVYENVKKYKMPIYTYGPIIHNDEVVKDLEQKGVKVINEVNALDNLGESIVIIRSHGVSPEINEKIKKNNILSIDMTCPYVKKIHKIVKENYDKGYQIIIVGDKKHAEVIGINGWCNNTAVIVNSIEECYDLEKYDKLCIVAQTTFNHDNWEEIKNFLNFNKCKEYIEFNTICNSTTERQKEAKEIASSSDAVIVIGSKHSSNTQKLFTVCSQYCKNCYLVQTTSDLDIKTLKNFENVGVTAGASTPNSIINEVINILNNIDNIEENIITNVNKEETLEIVEVNDNNAVDDVNIDEDKTLQIDNSKDVEEIFDFKNELNKTLKSINIGDIVDAEIVSISDEEVIVNFGYKSDGLIPINEICDDFENLNIGDKIQAIVINSDDDSNIILSKKQVDIEKTWKKINNAFESNSIILIKIIRQVKGGLLGLFEGLKVFIPMSQFSDKFVNDTSEYIDTVIPAKIIEFNENTQNIVVSSRIVLEENKQKDANNFWDAIFIGKEFKGRVIKLISYGAFVDIGEVNGLLHSSEIMLSKTEQLEKYINVDDEIDVYVKELDKENQKVLLGFKDKPKSPWSSIKYIIGDVVEGTVTKILPFGAFVQIDLGIEGLVHISQISDKRLLNPNEVLDIEEVIKVKILSIDKENKRIGLSIKDVAPINDKGQSNLEVSDNNNGFDFSNENLGVTISDAIKIKKWK